MQGIKMFLENNQQCDNEKNILLVHAALRKYKTLIGGLIVERLEGSSHI